MSSAHLQLAAKGQEDRWLSESPDRTYFEAKYQPRVNRSRETYEVPLDNQVKTFGMTGRCTIPVKGDYLTRLTLRAVFPPIYPTVAGEYVYPTPSSQVGASVYANMGLTLVVADGVTLTANTVGNHYMSVGAAVTLSGTAYRIFDLDGTYIVTSIPTANSFTCSTTLAGISYNGTMSFVGIACGDIISYFSTRNSNLWVNNLTNKTWGITNAVFNEAKTELTVTTSTPSGFSIGQQVNIIITSMSINGTYAVIDSSDTTFTIQCNPSYVFVIVGENNTTMYSLDNGQTWKYGNIPIIDYYFWYHVTYGNGKFVAVSAEGYVIQSIDGQTWTSPVYQDIVNVNYGGGKFIGTSGSGTIIKNSIDGVTWNSAYVPSGTSGFSEVAYGDGAYVAVSYHGYVIYSTDATTWTLSESVPFVAILGCVTYGDGKFVAIGGGSGYGISGAIYSTDGGVTWNLIPFPPLMFTAEDIIYGGGKFIAVTGNNTGICFSLDGNVWADSYTFINIYSETPSVTYGNNVFVSLGLNAVVYLSPDANVWTFASETPSFYGSYSITNGILYHTFSTKDVVTLSSPPLVVNTTPTQFRFSSNIYPSMSFANASDAAFWGFDARNGLTYSFPVTPPWTFTQGGWVSGFLPPSLSTWDDSVAHKLVRDARILVGKQTIKEYSGEYIELQNDLTVPYENKAILKLLNGTLDQTQATAAREYYTTLPLGTKEIPLCALTHQQMSVEVDFESFTNLSQNLNPGTGDFLNPQSYLTYDASTGILNGEPINVQTTFSYQQYIFIVTYGGQFIVYDTTKDFADPTSYIVLSAFAGTSLFSQFCVLSGTLYIGLSNGKLLSIIIDELIQGNTSSSILNNYAPTIGTLTGTIVADFRYLYYTVSNTASSNVFFSRYDTTGSFTSPGSYTSFDFTSNIDSSVTSLVYQMISTGSQLIALTNTPGKFYIFNLNAAFTLSWNSVDHSIYSHTQTITEGIVIGNTLYLITNTGSILTYTNGVFSDLIVLTTYPLFSAISETQFIQSNDDGETWNPVTGPTDIYEFWTAVTYGNGTFVAVLSYGQVFGAYSYDGDTWTKTNDLPVIQNGDWSAVTYGDGKFVAVSSGYGSMYSVDGKTWTLSSVVSGSGLFGVTYGNGKFVAVGWSSYVMYSSDGDVWTSATGSRGGDWNDVTYGDGKFVAVGSSGVMISTDGNTWSYATNGPYIDRGLQGVTYGGGKFVAVGFRRIIAYSFDGDNWTNIYDFPSDRGFNKVTFGNDTFVAVGLVLPVPGVQESILISKDGIAWTAPSSYPLSGIYTSGFSSVTGGFNTSSVLQYTGAFKNFHAVGSKIYASSNSSTISTVIEIDTSIDLNSPTAYKYYSSTDSTAPITFDGTAPKIFANGPRYVYMFSQSDPAAQNIVRFDPYPPTPTLQTSILVDYESLPPEVPKPDTALLGLVQTQKVTDMNYMNIRGPVKELWVTGASDSANVFQYSNLAAQSTLALTAGEEIITEDVGTRTFLSTIEPFETHTSMPIRNVSVIPFEFDPESEIPNGTVNFSRIRDQVFNGGAETVWARTYNLLAIQGGIGGLIFNS